MAVSKREKGTKMTKYSKENSRVYGVEIAKAAYKKLAEGHVEKLSFYTLEAAMQEADERVFEAEMSDDYGVTRAERREIAEYVKAAVEELKRRRAA